MALPAPPATRTPSTFFPFPTATTPIIPPIATTTSLPASTAQTASTTPRSRKPITSTLSSIIPAGTNDSKAEESSGMSGGAVAGLVIGILVLLVCSVVGGFMLLKKRRKRMMGRGQYNGYPDTSSRSRDLKQDDDDDSNMSKRQGSGGGLRGLVAGVLSKTQSLAAPKGNKPSATEEAAAAASPSPAVTMQQQQAQHVRAATPAPVPAANWGATASLPPPTPMGNVITPSTPANNGISSNYPSPGDVLISQPLHLPPTPQDQQQLNWQQQQVFQQRQMQQHQLQQQQFQQQQQQYQHQQQQQQQHQLQHMPVQGYAALPPAIQAPAMTPQHQLQHPSYQQQQQQPVQMQQVQHSVVSPTTITTPMAQPYYYQPGTGLVSIPHSVPPAEPYTPQPFQPPQPVQVMQAVTAPPPVPYAMNNAHYPAPSVSIASVPHVPPPPSHQHIQQQPVAYQPPPPTTQATVPPTVAAVATSTAPRSPTPESGSIFLPGDSSRLLLSQGLFKIVPDAEDEEEAKRSAEAAATTSQAGPNSVLSMDLNLGGDFLSSVLSFSNHQGPSNTNSFSSIPQGSSAVAAPVVNGGGAGVGAGSGSGAQGGQAVRQQPGYHDRQAGQKDRPKNQPRYLVDKEEYVDEQQQQHVQNEPSSTSQLSSEPVIVGSDIVFEPLPSVKAARERSNGGLDSTWSSSSSLLNNNTKQAAPTKENSQPKLIRSLSKVPTLGEMLPTMGTEEYLERTDDKEEYSARLHGDRESSTVASPRPMTNVIHPPRVGELSKEAQGGIVDIGTPITPNAILPTTTVEEAAASVISPPRSSTPATPPPLRLSTKPKFK
ncbi:hypothetical protein BGZ90_011352 [Linnemannia elongata]|nr:hypothetical protein BGZ90_011352 [Linnemannia elongata]